DQLDLGRDRNLILRRAALLLERDRKDAEAVDRAAKDRVRAVRIADQLQAAARDHLVAHRLRHQLLEAVARRAIDESRHLDGLDARIESVAVAHQRIATTGQQQQREIFHRTTTLTSLPGT